MQQVQVASGTGLDYVPWAEASQVTRFYAATTIPPGTLLTGAMVARVSGVATGRDIVGSRSRRASCPPSSGPVTSRDYAVSGQAGGSAGCPARRRRRADRRAVVVGVLTPGNGSLAGSASAGHRVTVAVSPADAGPVACAAAAGNVAVAVLPPVTDRRWP